jgi:hypothetical protein
MSVRKMMLVLFTDFGWEGPYVGMMKLALARRAPAVPVVDLQHDAPPFDAQSAAYLLAAYVPLFPAESVFVTVVDPGVGGDRAGIILRADGRLFVGPDNGLLDRVAFRARQKEAWHIVWRPRRLSASFHGRDLFAPIAAMLAAGTATPDRLGRAVTLQARPWPEELARIIYLDRYGNAASGVRAAALAPNARVGIGDRHLRRARTFSEVSPGQGFWYENSNGLVEVAVNQGSAAAAFGLRRGDALQIID